MIIISVILGIVFIAVVLLFVFIYKLNLYIGTLEEKLKAQIYLTENLKQSMKEIIAEDFLQNDGRLKKFNIQTERNVIFNGVRAEESESDF